MTDAQLGRAAVVADGRHGMFVLERRYGAVLHDVMVGGRGSVCGRRQHRVHGRKQAVRRTVVKTTLPRGHFARKDAAAERRGGEAAAGAPVYARAIVAVRHAACLGNGTVGKGPGVALGGFGGRRLGLSGRAGDGHDGRGDARGRMNARAGTAIDRGVGMLHTAVGPTEVGGQRDLRRGGAFVRRRGVVNVQAVHALVDATVDAAPARFQGGVVRVAVGAPALTIAVIGVKALVDGRQGAGRGA